MERFFIVFANCFYLFCRMGFLRFLLAISVVVAHSCALFGFDMLPGTLAVEAFFIISGFYMAMVLTEKYFKIDKYYKLFISNRFLRIYPLYWVVFIFFGIYFIADGYKTGNLHALQLYVTYWHKLNPWTFVYLIITNIVIIGQEYALFFKVNDNGAVLFTSHFADAKTALYRFLFDAPLWSVSLEFVFYIISPYLVKLKNNVLLIIAVLLFAARYISKINGVPFDPFVNRLLPYQILFFVLGILSYNLYQRLKTINIPKYAGGILLAYISIFTIIYTRLPGTDSKAFIYLLSFAILIPFVFEISKHSKADQLIGELSYPIYISHFLLLSISERLMVHYHINGEYLSLIAIVLIIVFSAILVRLVSKRIERYRARRVLKAT